MKTLVSRLWTDEDAFLRFARALLFGIATGMQQGVIPAGKLGWYVAPILQMLALAYGTKP